MDNTNRQLIRSILEQELQNLRMLRQLDWTSEGMDQDTVEILQRAEDEVETAVRSLDWASEDAIVWRGLFSQHPFPEAAVEDTQGRVYLASDEEGLRS